MPEPQPAWAQQYDVNMHPVWARYFEPPAVCGRESLGVMRALMLLYRETGEEEFLKPVPRALTYLKNSTYERGGRTVFARFYEFKTNKPLYITKGMSMVGNVTLRRPVDGYEVSYSDESVVGHYSLSTPAEALDAIEEEYKSTLAAGPETLKRPARLKGLAPGYARPQPPLSESELAAKANEAIAAMDKRGAWVTVTPELEREMFLRVRPNRNMIVRLHGKDIPGCYGDLIERALPHCTELRFLNPGTETCVANCRKRPWEPDKYASPEEQDSNLEELIAWVREYDERQDEYGLSRHRAIFDSFQGAKREYR